MTAPVTLTIYRYGSGDVSEFPSCSTRTRLVHPVLYPIVQWYILEAGAWEDEGGSAPRSQPSLSLHCSDGPVKWSGRNDPS